jgi:hypothetical protein
MKRSFLWGLSASLILGGIVLASIGDETMSRSGSIAVGFIGMLASGLTIRAARRSPPSHSWFTAIVGWVLGYFAAGVLFAPFIILIFALGYAR